MQLPPERPFPLVLSFALIRAAAFLVPAKDRGLFEHEWQQNLLHRWQFLYHTQLWNAREAVSLTIAALRCIPDAIQHFGAQDSVRTRVSGFIQSPITTLSGLLSLFLVICVVSGGLPATRNLFFNRIDHGSSKLVYVWTHNIRGGGDRPLPSEIIQAWKTHSQSISGAAAFRAVHRDIQVHGRSAEKRLVVTTEPSFFSVFTTQPLVGAVSNDAPSVALSYESWVRLFHASPKVLGTRIAVAGADYPVRAVLPAGFEPISKQLSIYLVQPRYYGRDAYGVVKAKPGVTQKALNKDFTDIAENVTYYFLNGQLRFGFAQSATWTPVRSFGIGALSSALMLIMVFRIRWSGLWPQAHQHRAFARRGAFFFTKTTLGLLCVFTACLEWSRSNSAILFGNFDPATGPFLCWLYIIGTMGVFFWSVFDQKARCRECLQLLAFPVRMGSPGSLLLDWSGIELCCTEGHGVLHVPHLAPSWAEETDHWIAMDESWQSIFGRAKK